MADLATPSAATISTVNAGADAPAASSSQLSTRPVRPDEDAFKAGLAEREATLDKAKKKQADAQQQFNDKRAAKSGDDPQVKQLREQMEQVKSQQASGKASRQQEMDRIKALDNQLKAKMNEQKAAKAHIPFKSTDEIDAEIKRLEKSVESGKLKMVEEKKALADVSSLNKQKKAFASLDERQRDIDKLKTQISEIKKSSNTAEAKQLQQDFDRIKAELDEFHLAKRDAAKDSDAAYEKLQQAKADNDKAWQELKQFKDAHYTAKRQYHDYEREAGRVRAAKQKAERDAYLHSRKQEALKMKLDEASAPAYGEEIRAAESIMRILDPSSVPSTATSTISEFAAKASRIVDASGIKGTVLTKKRDDEEAYFIGGGGKKGKKGKKSANATTNGVSSSAGSKDTLGKLWAPGSIEQFSKISIEPPSSADDLTSTLEKVSEKRHFYLEDRERKTKENVDNARAEFEALDSPGGQSSRETAQISTNGTAA